MQNTLPIIAEALLASVDVRPGPTCDGCDGTNNLQSIVRLTGLTSLVYLCAICAVNLAASIGAQLTLKHQHTQDLEDRKL